MEILTYPFFRNALLGVIIISLTAALVGTYIVTRRMVFISGGITHACFGGLGLGYWMGVPPFLMAAVFAVAGALGVDTLARRAVRRDTAIAVIWALGMALGILFVFLTPDYVPELNTFLFGNVLTITQTDLIIYLIFALLAALIFFPLRRLIIAVSFDPDFAATRHLPVRLISTAMTVVVAVAIVLTIRMAGIMLLMSLLSIPQVTAELFTRRYMRMLLLSAIISLAGSVGGLFLSYWISVPTSAAIVILMVVIYLVSAPLARSLRNRR